MAPNAFRLDVESARTWSEVSRDALAVLKEDICDAVSPPTASETREVRRVVLRAAKLEADIRAIWVDVNAAISSVPKAAA